MKRQFTLEYWIDDNWYVGKLKEIPGVFSQAESIDELEENIKDAYYQLIMEESISGTPSQAKTKDITLDIA
jgi:predicted RNase H-like HicB family nuclease